MKTSRNKDYILNYIFVGCLLILILNDHYLKYEYGNWLTGKLSDAVGIIMLPLLITFLFPAVKERSILITALFFTFWKSPFSQKLIDLYNQYTFVQTSRVVDFTDLFVFILLPLPYLLIKRSGLLNPLKINRVHPIMLLLPTAFGLMATSPPQSYYYTRSNGNLRCHKCYITVNYNPDEIETMLKKENIILSTETTAADEYFWWWRQRTYEGLRYYRINMLVIDKDTLRDIDLCMWTIKNKKTQIYFNGMNVPDSVSTRNLYSKLGKRYKTLLFGILQPKLAD